MIDRAWSVLTDVRVPGLLLLASGTVLMASPWMHTPDPLVVSWWESTLHLPSTLGVAAGLAAAGLVLMLGVLFNRYRMATDPDAQTKASPDALINVGAVVDDVEESGAANLSWAGVACMVAGIALVVGYWFTVQQSVGAARMPLTIGQTAENYAVPFGNKEMKVNLPLRVRLSALRAGDHPVASLQMFQAGQKPPAAQKIEAGSGVELKNLRLTFTGIAPDSSKLRAVFGSDKPNTITAGAAKGDSFRVSLKGPKYKVLDVTDNYMGVMGPAAHIRAPKVGDFWVFQRQADADVAPKLGHSIRLERVQTQPAAIFTVAPRRPFWPLSAGGTLFIIGFAMLIVFPERILWIGEGRKARLWSFNEAGRLAEQTLDEAGGQGRVN